MDDETKSKDRKGALNDRRRIHIIHLNSSIYHYRYGHLVDFDQNQSRSRCKLPGCKGFTHAFCIKCDTHLCCIQKRNCFLVHHTNKQVKAAKQTKSIKPVKRPTQTKAKKKVQSEAAQKMRRVQYGTRNGSRRTSIRKQNALPTILKTTVSTNMNGRPKKVQWKSELCETLIFHDETSNQEIDKPAKVRGSFMPSIHDSNDSIANSVSPQRQSRRKTKHQVKANSDQLEFIVMEN